MNTPGGVPHNGVGPADIDPASPETIQKRALDREWAERLAKAHLEEARRHLREAEAIPGDVWGRRAAQDAIWHVTEAIQGITRF